MRIAYCSPLPPQSSGIADYSVELIPALAGCGLEIGVFFEGRAAPTGEVGANFSCTPVRELSRVASEFDLVLYQLGNSAAHHAEIFRTLLELPGLVVLHEYLLHHLVRELTLGAGDVDGYVDELRYAAGETGRRAARRLLDAHLPLDPWEFPLFERVVDASLGVLVHSQFAQRRILASRPAAAVEAVPFPVDLERDGLVTAAERQAARRLLGLPLDAFVIGNFGFVTPQKRLEPALRAFAELARDHPQALFLVCGEISPYYDFERLRSAIGEQRIVVSERVDLARFRASMRACDLAVNLRHPTGGETSASLLRLLAAGIPTVVTETGSFAELPDGVVAKVALDEFETAQLEAIYRRIADDSGLAATMSLAARRYVESHHAVASTAQAYHAAILAAAARRPHFREPTPPPRADCEEEPREGLLASVGANLADLGLDETEEGLFSEVSRVVAELGWAPRSRRR